MGARKAESARRRQSTVAVIASRSDASPRASTEAEPLVFARHETFHPRFGWLKKGFDKAIEDPTIFVQPDAAIRLGVGKNMVRAIRYWCTAFKLLTEPARSRGGETVATEFGTKLLAHDAGFDPYLEDLGSLWLLHWRLLQRPCTASAWHFAFNLFSQPEFAIDDMVGAMSEWLDRESPGSRVVEASLRKDVHCIIRMYADVEHEYALNEDSIHCPFVELSLIRPLSGQKRAYSFSLGDKPGLSSELLTHACLDFAARESIAARSISISRLLLAPSSPGMVFKLTESALYEALEECASADKRLQLSDTAGLVQLSFSEDPAKLSRHYLKRHFQQYAYRRSA